MPRRNKAESITVDEVVKRLDYLHMNEMANRLKELDESGELVSCTPLDIVNDLATSQEIATSNNIVARYKKQAKFYYPFADLADVIPKAERHINIPLVERLESGEYNEFPRGKPQASTGRLPGRHSLPAGVSFLMRRSHFEIQLFVRILCTLILHIFSNRIFINVFSNC
ncbi:MAG: hypothetical protein LKE87_11050 [Solobacterium sp.]|jgi:hypothetical protein|nr:hypothetical protein [Solobacterium sp.]